MKKVARLSKVSVIFFKHNEIFLTMKCFEPICPRGRQNLTRNHMGMVLRLSKSYFVFFKHNQIFSIMKISQKLHIRISLGPVVLGSRDSPKFPLSSSNTINLYWWWKYLENYIHGYFHYTGIFQLDLKYIYILLMLNVKDNLIF